MSFTAKDRQRIIDDYLNRSGRNVFQPAEFIDWLAEQPDHEAYPWFFGMDDASAAREHRIQMARRMANGLRITARVQETASASAPMSVRVREFPALISPVVGRKDGGGYVAFHPEDTTSVDELRRQGAQSLRAWLARYRGVAEMGGLDVGPIEKIAAKLDGSVVVAAE